MKKDVEDGKIVEIVEKREEEIGKVIFFTDQRVCYKKGCEHLSGLIKIAEGKITVLSEIIEGYMVVSIE